MAGSKLQAVSFELQVFSYKLQAKPRFVKDDWEATNDMEASSPSPLGEGPEVRFEQPLAKFRFKKDDQNLKDDVEDLQLKKARTNRPISPWRGSGGEVRSR